MEKQLPVNSPLEEQLESMSLHFGRSAIYRQLDNGMANQRRINVIE